MMFTIRRVEFLGVLIKMVSETFDFNLVQFEIKILENRPNLRIFSRVDYGDTVFCKPIRSVKLNIDEVNKTLTLEDREDVN